MANVLTDTSSALSKQRAADIFLFNASIDRNSADTLIQEVQKAVARKHRNQEALLFLTTYGGDPDSAFRIARSLKNNYQLLTVYVLGFCKSAGTLIVLGANEIVMSTYGELGPLDVQLSKQDDMLHRDSGLNFLGALELVTSQTFSAFESYFVQIIQGSGGTITTHTAGEIATNVAVGLYGKLMEQLDPIQVAEVKRSMRIANDYGNILCKNSELVEKLISNYPSHSYVIDFVQAQDLFKGVIPIRIPSEEEMELCSILQGLMLHQRKEAMICLLNPDVNEPDSMKEEQNHEHASSHPASNPSESGGSDVQTLNGPGHVTDKGGGNSL